MRPSGVLVAALALVLLIAVGSVRARPLAGTPGAADLQAKAGAKKPAPPAPAAKKGAGAPPVTGNTPSPGMAPRVAALASIYASAYNASLNFRAAMNASRTRPACVGRLC
ncbi:MAG: hypothetical protein J3K34DRAFT_401654 [Monoraphidium minutum]|nr:MAG: hypothetical protein J3K34DRAFT_401654 [Monoraphidium minutum]